MLTINKLESNKFIWNNIIIKSSELCNIYICVSVLNYNIHRIMLKYL